jgi:hypothetical protein
MPVDHGAGCPARRLPFVWSLTAALALSAGASPIAFASAAPAAAKALDATATPRMLSAGQAGSRSQVPWRKVGTGWAIAEYAESTAEPTKLELIDPAGGKYVLYKWRPSSTPQLIGWSGGKTRALLEEPTGKRPTMVQLVLATGHVTKPFTLPAGALPLGYTEPDGTSMLAADDGIVRYNLHGQFQARLIRGSQHDTEISAPDGASYVVSSGTGVDLVRRRGGVIRGLPVPGADANLGGCSPVRWWNPATALATCSTRSGAPRLWLVPVSGSKPKALTPPRGSKGPDLGDVDAWQFRSGLYVQALGFCSTVFIGKQAKNGSVKAVNVPGGEDNNLVAVTAGNRMLVQEFDSCSPISALVWFNPATRTVQKVLSPPTSGIGVMTVLGYNREGNEPGNSQ